MSWTAAVMPANPRVNPVTHESPRWPSARCRSGRTGETWISGHRSARATSASRPSCHNRPVVPAGASGRAAARRRRSRTSFLSIPYDHSRFRGKADDSPPPLKSSAHSAPATRSPMAFGVP
jgi:hypothetical protein